jgi:DNA modification methylase
VGSGTIAVVCKKQKRRFVGIDSNEDYLIMAKNRITAINNI